jgi:hypothetical protein
MSTPESRKPAVHVRGSGTKHDASDSTKRMQTSIPMREATPDNVSPNSALAGFSRVSIFGPRQKSRVCKGCVWVCLCWGAACWSPRAAGVFLPRLSLFFLKLTPSLRRQTKGKHEQLQLDQLQGGGERAAAVAVLFLANFLFGQICGAFLSLCLLGVCSDMRPSQCSAMEAWERRR